MNIMEIACDFNNNIDYVNCGLNVFKSVYPDANCFSTQFHGTMQMS